MSAAVIDAYYTQAVAAGDSARSRAQAAQSACSGVGAIILAYLSVTSSLPNWAAVAAFVLSTIAWAAAAVVFALAVGTIVRTPEGHEVRSADDLVTTVLDHVRSDRDRVARRQRVAVIFAAVGWVSAIAGVVLSVEVADSPGYSFVVRPTVEQSQLLMESCHWSGSLIVGSVEAESIEEDDPVLVLAPDICPGKRMSINPTAQQWSETLVEKHD